MTTITVTYGADDAYAFAQAHLAPHAWTAISAALAVIRNHIKHEVLSPTQTIERVQVILNDAQLRLEE